MIKHIYFVPSKHRRRTQQYAYTKPSFCIFPPFVPHPCTTKKSLPSLVKKFFFFFPVPAKETPLPSLGLYKSNFISSFTASHIGCDVTSVLQRHFINGKSYRQPWVVALIIFNFMGSKNDKVFLSWFRRLFNLKTGRLVNIVVRAFAWYALGSGFESRISHGCSLPRPHPVLFFSTPLVKAL